MRNSFVRKAKSNRVRQGFTLLELMIVACIVAVLAAALLNRVRFYQKMAEKTAVEQTVGTLQSALNLRFGALIAREELEKISELVKQNPMSWLAQKPANYAGEYFKKQEEVIAGNWYFDLESRTLVYFVLNHTGANKGEALPQLRFKTKIVSGSEDFPGKNGSIAGKTVEGVVVEQIVPYAWD